MRKTDAFRRAAALLAALSITVSLAAPAFAGTYYIDNGDITITKKDDGSQEIKQNGTIIENDDRGEIVITTYKKAITTLESDLEGPAAEDSGFGPVVEDNYQPAPPAQPEDAEEPKDADQPEDDDQKKSTEESEDDDQKNAEESENDEEQKDADRQENTDRQESAEEQESAGQQPQPQQAAPADAAPAAPAPANGFCKNIITVINNAATALKLTLKDVKIDVSDTGDEWYGVVGKAALSVQGKGNVEIELDGDNELKSGFNRAGLEKNTSDSTGTLTLKDDKKDDNKEAGSLKATGGKYGAGIGGSKDNGTNNITINGGTVTATGGYWSAGIGGGHNDFGNNGDGINITINGGTVNAAGDRFGAGIGGGDYGSGKNITINGGTVNAAGGNGAGIGGGDRGSGENITINGGTVTAASGSGAGIGGGDYGSGKNITINGGTVEATGGDFGAGIGGGAAGSGTNITITGGTVTATGSVFGAGIGGGEKGNGKNITITGGTVNAAGGNGAGIGGGEKANGEDITITGGTVTAKGHLGGAGIGGGEKGNGKNITITGGTVTAKGGVFGAGIGGGYGGIGSNVTVSGAAQVTAIAGKPDLGGAGATIGGGSSTQDSDGNTVPTPGTEIQADIKGLTTGYIHHIIYNLDDSLKREWWEFALPKPIPDGESLDLHVETLKGAPLLFNTRQQGSTLRVTSDNLSARLHGTRQALEALQEQGVEQIQFVTTLKTTTLSVEDLLTEGGSWFALEHDGLVSRQLSAAQAESLKCWMH